MIKKNKEVKVIIQNKQNSNDKPNVETAKKIIICIERCRKDFLESENGSEEL